MSRPAHWLRVLSRILCPPLRSSVGDVSGAARVTAVHSRLLVSGGRLWAALTRPVTGQTGHHAALTRPVTGQTGHHAALTRPVTGQTGHHAALTRPVTGQTGHHAAVGRPVCAGRFVYGKGTSTFASHAYCFDIQLEPDFRPRNQDGEAEEFLLVTPQVSKYPLYCISLFFVYFILRILLCIIYLFFFSGTP